MRRQTYGYLPSLKASPPIGWYQIILLGDRGIIDKAAMNVFDCAVSASTTPPLIPDDSQNLKTTTTTAATATTTTAFYDEVWFIVVVCIAAVVSLILFVLAMIRCCCGARRQPYVRRRVPLDGSVRTSPPSYRHHVNNQRQFLFDRLHYVRLRSSQAVR